MSWTLHLLRSALPLCVALSCACFHTQAAEADHLTPLRRGLLPDDTVIAPADGPGPDALFGGLRVDPNSNLRLRRTDGTMTPWFRASALRVSDDGLFVATREVPWTEVETIVVTGLQDDAVSQLQRTAPPSAAVNVATQGFVTLEVREHDAQAWLKAFVAACDQAQTAWRGRWTLRAAKAGPLPAMDGEEVRAALGGTIAVADGIRWFDLAGAEVSNLDGAMTFLALVVVPLSLTAGHVPVRDDDHADLLGVPAMALRPAAGRVVGRADLVAPRTDGARPLFGDDALRKAAVRWVVWTSGTTEVTRAEQLALTAGAAVRLRDVFELGLGLSTYWRAPFIPGGHLPGPPLSPGPNAATPTVLVLARAIAHLDVDPARRFALPLGAEAAAGVDGTLQLRFRYGVRFRPAPSWVLALYPFNAQLTALPAWTPPDEDAWTFPWSVEVVREF